MKTISLLAFAIALLFAPPLSSAPLQQAYLKASAPAADDQFGHSVAISGNTAVVGANREGSDAGAAYVFVRNGSNWVLQQRLEASNAGAGDQFGFSVAIDGNTVVVGAPQEDGGAGAAYVFVRVGESWSEEDLLKASNAEADDEFGASVAVSGDTAIVGAPEEDGTASNAGAAYVFVRAGEDWSEQELLKASNAGVNAYFGSSVDLDGETAIVGAMFESSVASFSGAAYIFVRDGIEWDEQDHLKASNPGNSDQFGISVAISGDTAIVGANQEDGNGTGVNNGDPGNNNAFNAGAAYLFTRENVTWTQDAYLKASNTSTSSDAQFGFSVALDGDVAVVGARFEDNDAKGVNSSVNNSDASESGAAYVFVREGGVWQSEAYLKASNTETYDNFGWSVAVGGDTVLVGAYREGSNGNSQTNNFAAGSGAAYVFSFAEVVAPPPPPTPARIFLQKPKRFPVTQVGRRSKTQVVKITNTGGSPLSKLSVLVSGKAKRDFLAAGPAKKTLAPGASTTVRLTFRPRAAGARNAQMTVRGNVAPAKTQLAGRARAK